jgi:hypothetical protein
MESMRRPESLARQWRQLQARQRREFKDAISAKRRELEAVAAPILASLKSSAMSPAQQKRCRKQVALTLRIKLRDYRDERIQQTRKTAREDAEKLRAPDLEAPASALADPTGVEIKTLRSPAPVRWDTVVDLHPFSESHDVAQVHTSVEDIAQHLAIVDELRDGSRIRGRQTPKDKASDRAYAIAAQRALRPTAEAILGRMGKDLNRFFESYLAWHSLSEVTTDGALQVLERLPATLALGLLSHPSMQDHIERLRKRGRRERAVRERLRKAFFKLATVAESPGRPKGQRHQLSQRESLEMGKACRRIHKDVVGFRSDRRGVIDVDGVVAARGIVVRYASGLSEGSITHLARQLCKVKIRPFRVTREILQACHPGHELAITERVVRGFVAQRTK